MFAGPFCYHLLFEQQLWKQNRSTLVLESPKKIKSVNELSKLIFIKSQMKKKKSNFTSHKVLQKTDLNPKASPVALLLTNFHFDSIFHRSGEIKIPSISCELFLVREFHEKWNILECGSFFSTFFGPIYFKNSMLFV